VHEDSDIDASVLLKFWDDVDGETGSSSSLTIGSWKRKAAWGTFNAASTSRKVRLRTTSAVAGNIYCDCLHLVENQAHIWPAFDAGEVTLVATLSQIPAAEALRQVMDSESGLVYFRGDGFCIFKNAGFRPANKSPDATFTDQEGQALKPSKLNVAWDSYDRVSRVRVHGRGQTKEITEDSAITVWECEYVPFVVEDVNAGSHKSKRAIRVDFHDANIINPTLNIPPAASGTKHAKFENRGSYAIIWLWNTGFTDWTITALSVTATKRETYTDTVSFIERYPIGNYVRDPSYERGDNDSDGISDGWEEADKSANVTATWSLDTGTKKFGVQSQKLVLTGDAGASGGIIKLQAIDADVAAVEEDEEYAVSGYINITAISGCPIGLMVEWLDSGKSHVSDTSIDAKGTTTSGFERLSGTGTVPAGAYYARVYWKVVSIDEGDSLTCYLDGIQYEKASAVGDYCDGDQPDCLWEGTDHGGRSCRIPDLLVHRTLSWRMPLIDSDSDEAIDQAVRFANRYSGRITTAEMLLLPGNDSLIDQMLGRDINDLIAIISDYEDGKLGWASPGKEFWVEGVRYTFRPGIIAEAAFSLEEK